MSDLPHEPDHHRLLWLHRRLQDGVLAVRGGALEQPAWYVEDMQLLDLMDYYTGLDERIHDCDENMARLRKGQPHGG